MGDADDVKSLADAIASATEALTPWIMTAEQEAAVLVAGSERKAKAKARWERQLDELTPSRYAWATPMAPELGSRVGHPSPNVWAAAPPTTASVVIAGPSSSGKTSLAAAALRGLVMARKLPISEACFVSSYRLSVARSQSKLGAGEPEDVLRAMRCGHLVIDDLGQERENPSSAIADVIFERHDRELTTWVTTGFTREEVMRRYGAGVARRLLDGATSLRLVRP